MWNFTNSTLVLFEQFTSLQFSLLYATSNSWLEILNCWCFHRQCGCRRRWNWGCSSRTSTFTIVWEKPLWRTNQWPWCMNPSPWRRESRISSTEGSNQTSVKKTILLFNVNSFECLVYTVTWSFSVTLTFLVALSIKRMSCQTCFVCYSSGTTEIHHVAKFKKHVQLL